MSNQYLTKRRRVRLMADEENPEEYGYLIEGPDTNDMYVVELDEQYLSDADDGLREVSRDQFEIIDDAFDSL